jgi:hypothetical protein
MLSHEKRPHPFDKLRVRAKPTRRKATPEDQAFGVTGT